MKYDRIVFMRKVNEKYRLKDFWDFGLKQFRSAIFGITIILSLIVTTFIKIPHLARMIRY
ncbi:hypothetical protein QK908_10470 [Lactococcus cremoris]